MLQSKGDNQMDQTTSTLSANTLHCALELSKNSLLLAIQFPDREQPSLYPIEGGNTEKLMAKLTAALDCWAKVSGSPPAITWCRGERHVWSLVRIPSIDEEDLRRSHRERGRLVRERTAHINRIKGLLFGQGIRGINVKSKYKTLAVDNLVSALSAELVD